MQKSSPLILSVLLVALAMFPSGTRAEAAATTDSQSQLISQVVATVNITNAAMTAQQDHTFTIDFDISNRIGIQPDVKYGASLVSAGSGGVSVVDQHVYDDVLTLQPGVTLHKTITYVAPASLSGNYKLRLLSEDSRGVPLSSAMLGTVTLPDSKAGSIAIDPASCYLSQGNTGAHQALGGTLLFDPAKTLSMTVTCAVKNTTRNSITLLPQLTQYVGDAYGDVVAGESSAPSASLALASGESKTVSIAIPHMTEPRTYYATLAFHNQDSSLESNTIAFRYSVSGVGASIQTLLLDKDSYAKGETVLVSFLWTLFDNPLPNSKGGTIPPPVISASLSMTDGNHQACAPQITQTLTQNGRMVEVPVTMLTDCRNPEITLSLLDAAQRTLDTKSYSIVSLTASETSPAGAALLTPDGYLVVAGIILSLLGVVYLFFNKKRNVISPVLLVLFSVSAFFYGGSYAHADTITISSVYCLTQTCREPPITITYSLDKALYAPGDTVTVNYYAQANQVVFPNSVCLFAKGNINNGPYGANAFANLSTPCIPPTALFDGVGASASAGSAPSATGAVYTTFGSTNLGYQTAYGSPLTLTVTNKCIGLTGDTPKVGANTCPAVGSLCVRTTTWKCVQGNFQFVASCSTNNCSSATVPVCSITQWSFGTETGGYDTLYVGQSGNYKNTSPFSLSSTGKGTGYTCTGMNGGVCNTITTAAYNTYQGYTFACCGTGTTWDTTSNTCVSTSNPTVTGACGTANGVAYAYGSSSYSPYAQCGSGSPSTTAFPAAGSSQTWTCSGTNGGAASGTCTASQNAPASCTLPWGGTLASGSSVTAYQSSSATSPTKCSSISETRTCTNGTLSGSYTYPSCTDLTPVNGSCGTANTKTYPNGSTSYGTDTQCKNGTPSTTAFPAAGATQTWDCTGSNGGTKASCSASQAGNPCTAQTVNHCALPGPTTSGTSVAGSCSSGYSGTCSYSCSNGTWSTNSNACVLAPPTTPTLSALWQGGTYLGPSASAYDANGYQLSAQATSPSGANLNYYFEWSPTETAQWSGWTGSGGWGSVTHYADSAAGTYYARAWAYDANGNWSTLPSSWMTITLTTAAPTVSCVGTPGNPYVGQQVTWSSTASGGSRSYTYAWTDSAGSPLGTTPSASQTSATYTTIGQKNATLKVSDTKTGLSTSATCTTGVNQPNGPTNGGTCPNVGVCPGTCTASLTASPDPVEQGQNTTLTWGVTGGTLCATACTGSGFSTGAGSAISGTATVSPDPVNHNYALTCTGGTYGPPPPVNYTVNVLVPTVTFTVNGQTSTARVNPNTANNTTIVWSSTNASSCTGTNFSTGTATSGSVTRTTTAQTVYKVDCVNNHGTHATASVTVNVLAGFNEF